MRLTKRGADYLKACVVTTVMCSFLNIRMLLALSLALMIAALISQVLLATASGKNIKVELENPHLSIFKGDTGIEKITIISRARRFISVRVALIKGPDGVLSSAKETAGVMTFTFMPEYAGRFKGLVVTFELKDPLQLFHKTMQISRPEFIIDSLPKSLLADIRMARPMSLTLGERTGRTYGAGQEFYALDEYTNQIEKRDIMWKAVARMPEGDKLIVRVRESNIPKTLKIGILKVAQRSVQDELRWTDIACEGAGLLGHIILLVGCDVELIYTVANSAVVSHASDISELSSAIMEMSASGMASGEETASIIAESDICITGMKELEEQLFALAISRKPSLLISELESAPWTIGNLAVVFSGTEDVNRLVNAVVGK